MQQQQHASRKLFLRACVHKKKFVDACAFLLVATCVCIADLLEECHVGIVHASGDSKLLWQQVVIVAAAVAACLCTCMLLAVAA